MDEFFDAFRMNMKYYREEKKNWTQAELAVQANSSIGQIGNIESGNSKPSFQNIIAIAIALDVHPADLFLRDSSKFQNLELIQQYNTMPEYQKSSIRQLIRNLSENTPSYKS